MKKSKKSHNGKITTTPEADAFTVAEFCDRHRISTQFFYKYRGQMPATIHIGSRVLISREAAAAWRRAHSKQVRP